MKLQKGKWYVCIKSWSDDGWTKFWEGSIIQCVKDDELTDCYDISHLFVDDEPEQIFREATELECNIASATEVDMKEFVKEFGSFESEETLMNIYQKGAEDMLWHIRRILNIHGKED